MKSCRLLMILVFALTFAPILQAQGEDYSRPKRYFIIAPSVSSSFFGGGNEGSPYFFGNLTLAWAAGAGPYIKFGTNFIDEHFSFDIQSKLSNPEIFWSSAYEVVHPLTYCSVGMVVALSEHCFFNFGPSYGRRFEIKKTSSGNMRDLSESIDGIGVDLGMLFRFGNLGFNLGFNSFGLAKIESSSDYSCYSAELGMALFL